MVTVSYTHQFPYFHDTRGKRFPAFVVQIAHPEQPQQGIDIEAYLDSGTRRTLIDGRWARAIGLDLLAGERKTYSSTTGVAVEARLHTILISHSLLDVFELKVGFSLGEISRNLLGRDFFNLIQVGFRERHQVFYIEPSP